MFVGVYSGSPPRSVLLHQPAYLTSQQRSEHFCSRLGKVPTVDADEHPVGRENRHRLLGIDDRRDQAHRQGKQCSHDTDVPDSACLSAKVIRSSAKCFFLIQKPTPSGDGKAKSLTTQMDQETGTTAGHRERHVTKAIGDIIMPAPVFVESCGRFRLRICGSRSIHAPAVQADSQLG